MVAISFLYFYIIQYENVFSRYKVPIFPILKLKALIFENTYLFWLAKEKHRYLDRFIFMFVYANK